MELKLKPIIESYDKIIDLIEKLYVNYANEVKLKVENKDKQLYKRNLQSLGDYGLVQNLESTLYGFRVDVSSTILTWYLRHYQDIEFYRELSNDDPDVYLSKIQHLKRMFKLSTGFHCEHCCQEHDDNDSDNDDI